MGCGSCPKKQMKLNSEPQPMSEQQVQELQAYLTHRILVKDRTGMKITGRCVEIWIDDDQPKDAVEFGSIAIDTIGGLALVGLNMIDSIELIPAPGSPTHQ